jgi:mRNA interferase MazF
MKVKRGEIWYVDLGVGIGSEQNGIRPILIVQNAVGNKYSPTTIISVISSQLNKAKLPTHVFIRPTKTNGLNLMSVVFLEQLRTIDERRLMEKTGDLEVDVMELVDKALLISLGLAN